MGRRGWIIAGIAALLIVGSIIALMALTGEFGYRTMTGPVAIIQGPLPTNGFLGVGFTSDAIGPATISHVVAGSGAAEAGLTVGDVIVAVGDVKDPNSVAVQRATVNTKPGEELALRIRHSDGKEADVSVRLISMQDMMLLGAAEAQDARERARAAATMSTTATTATTMPAN